MTDDADSWLTAIFWGCVVFAVLAICGGLRCEYRIHIDSRPTEAKK